MEADSITHKLPIVVRAEIAKMDPNEQSQFLSEFRRRRKGVAMAYFASLLSLHYAYLGRLGMTLLMWLVAIVTFGIGLAIWWVIDLFRIPSMVRNRNSDIAIEVLRDHRIIRGG